jgi:hypothetical protein
VTVGFNGPWLSWLNHVGYTVRTTTDTVFYGTGLFVALAPRIVVRCDIVGTHFVKDQIQGEDLVSFSGGLDLRLGETGNVRWTLCGSGENGMTDESVDWGTGGSTVIEYASR